MKALQLYEQEHFSGFNR